MKFQFGDLVVDSEREPWKSEGIRIGFYSAPGTRKSFTVAACIVEPFLDEGGTVVIFQPRSEWHTLKQRYESVLVVGGPFQDIPLSIKEARIYAEAIVKHGVSIVFDFSEVEEKDLVRFAAELLARIFTLQNVIRRPLLLFIEEGSDYCPFSSRGKLVEPWVYDRMVSRITKIATQGRPLGFMIVITSQRPAQLNFTVRMMCNLSFYGKFHPKDLNDIKEVLKAYDVLVKETAEKCVTMPHGSWLAISETAQYLTITKQRKTPHGADTPKLEYEAPRTEETKHTIQQLTKIINEALERERIEESEVTKLRKQVKDLSKQLNEKTLEIKRLTQIADTLGKIKIEQSTSAITSTEIQTIEREVAQRLKTKIMAVFDEYKPSEIPKRETLDLYEIWEPKLPSLCAKRILKFLLENKTAKYTKAQLGVSLGYKTSSGTFNGAISFLKQNNLIEYNGKLVWCN